MVYLTARRHPIARQLVTIGTATASLAHPREVFKGAILAGAVSILITHNHPSGDPEPSSADVGMTRQLREAGRILGIEVADHIILGRPEHDPLGRGYFSFRLAAHVDQGASAPFFVRSLQGLNPEKAIDTGLCYNHSMNQGFIYAIGAAITWGAVYTIDQRVLANASPLALLFVDSVITALVILPIMYFDHKAVWEIATSGKANVMLILLSIVLVLLANFLIFSAIKMIGASSASIIEIAYPFFVVLFSSLFLGANLGPAVIIGGTFIFVGTTILIYFS